MAVSTGGDWALTPHPSSSLQENEASYGEIWVPTVRKVFFRTVPSLLTLYGKRKMAFMEKKQNRRRHHHHHHHHQFLKWPE